MKKEDKDLLLKDLCGRLPYGVKVKVIYRAEYPDEDDIEGCFFLNQIDTRCPENLYWIGGNQLQEHGINRNISSFATCSEDEDEIVKPYLFPLSSMTEEQEDEWCDACLQPLIKRLDRHIRKEDLMLYAESQYAGSDWLNKNHFDYRGLIEKGLAIDATGLGIYE